MNVVMGILRKAIFSVLACALAWGLSELLYEICKSGQIYQAGKEQRWRFVLFIFQRSHAVYDLLFWQSIGRTLWRSDFVCRGLDGKDLKRKRSGQLQKQHGIDRINRRVWFTPALGHKAGPYCRPVLMSVSERNGYQLSWSLRPCQPSPTAKPGCRRTIAPAAPSPPAGWWRPRSWCCHSYSSSMPGVLLSMK